MDGCQEEAFAWNDVVPYSSNFLELPSRVPPHSPLPGRFCWAWCCLCLVFEWLIYAVLRWEWEVLCARAWVLLQYKLPAKLATLSRSIHVHGKEAKVPLKSAAIMAYVSFWSLQWSFLQSRMTALLHTQDISHILTYFIVKPKIQFAAFCSLLTLVYIDGCIVVLQYWRE